MHPRVLVRLVIAWIVVAAPAARATTWQVPSQQPTIESALAAAAAGDTIVVDCGTYVEHDLGLKGGVTLRSASGDPSCVTIDAQGQGRLFDLLDQAGRVTLEGLTLTGGATPNGWIEASGGGVRTQNSHLRIVDCVFTGHGARIGAALGVHRSTIEIEGTSFVDNHATHDVWASGGAIWAFESNGWVRGCVFDGNTAFSTNADDPGDGGAVLVNASQIAIEDCTFTGNATAAGGGAFYSLTDDLSTVRRSVFENNLAAWGGAVYFEIRSRAEMDSCTFRANVADYGGAMLVDRNCIPTIRDCVFEDNVAVVADGGAVQSYEASPEFLRCTFRGNSAQQRGGAIEMAAGTPRIELCVFVQNTAIVEGGAIQLDRSFVNLTRSTLVQNAAPRGSQIATAGVSSLVSTRNLLVGGVGGEGLYLAAGGFASISCTDLYGNQGGDWTGSIAALQFTSGNLSVDPLFVDATAGDYRLACGSPAGSDANLSCGLIGALPEACGDPDPTPAPPLLRTSVRVVPNPFNARTEIVFTLDRAAEVEASIVSIDGRIVRRLVRGGFAAGPHALVWDGRDDAAAAVASGTYLVRLRIGDRVVARKLALVE